MIRIKNLHKSYEMGSNSLHVLKGIDFNVIEGEQKDYLYLELLKQEEKILKRLSIFDKIKYRKLLNEIKFRRKFLEN